MKLELPDHKQLLHTMVIPIRWGDMDAFGHVNNTVYLRYMETARIDLMRAAGFPFATGGASVVIANLFCNFLRALEFPGDVLIRSYVGSVGRSSFDVYHDLLRTDGGDAVYANGGSTVVCVDPASQKSQPMPAYLRDWLLQGAA